jgi:hypothetical protein
MQEEIKITSVTVFVNPYTELDEEEQEKAKDEKDIGDEENVTFWAPFGVEKRHFKFLFINFGLERVMWILFVCYFLGKDWVMV